MPHVGRIGLHDIRMAVPSSATQSAGRAISLRSLLAIMIVLATLLVLLSNYSAGVAAGDMDAATDMASYARLGKLINTYIPYLGNSGDGDPDATETSVIQQTELCPNCNCSVRGAFTETPVFSEAVPSLRNARTLSRTSSRLVKRYLLHHIQLYSWSHPIHISDAVTAKLLQSWFSCPDTLLAFNFSNLILNKPTAYPYTRTGSGGRLTANIRRLRYLKRHAETIQKFQELVKIEGYYDGTHYSERQLVWIIVEDGVRIDPSIKELLDASGLAYLYIAHGPTHRYGNAQWQIAERAVHVLRDAFFADGPVLNIDDDSRILPELLSRVWKVQKAIFWQVGNMGRSGHLHEGPIFRQSKVVNWIIGGMPHRKFPVDMNGFAYNSSAIGDGRAVHPPKYVPRDDFGGESEFLEQILKSRAEVEALCEDSAIEPCHLAWHNWVEHEQPKRAQLMPIAARNRRHSALAAELGLGAA